MQDSIIEFEVYDDVRIIKYVTRFGEHLENRELMGAEFESSCPGCGYWQKFVPSFVAVQFWDGKHSICHKCNLYFDWNSRKVVTANGVIYTEHVKKLGESRSLQVDWVMTHFENIVADTERHVILDMIQYGEAFLEFTFSDKDQKKEVMSYCVGYIRGVQDRPMEWEE